MHQSNELAEIDALLGKSDMDSMDWCEYAYEDGEALLANLNPEDRHALFRSSIAKPANWRGCLVSILQPSKVDEGEELIRALSDIDSNVAGEALRQIYFYCGLNRSVNRGVFEDSEIRINSFRDRVMLDQSVMRRIQQLSEANFYLDYWHVLSGGAGAIE